MSLEGVQKEESFESAQAVIGHMQTIIDIISEDQKRKLFLHGDQEGNLHALLINYFTNMFRYAEKLENTSNNTEVKTITERIKIELQKIAQIQRSLSSGVSIDSEISNHIREMNDFLENIRKIQQHITSKK